MQWYKKEEFVRGSTDQLQETFDCKLKFSVVGAKSVSGGCVLTTSVATRIIEMEIRI